MKPTAVVGRRVVAFLVDGLVLAAANAALFFPLASTGEDIASRVLSGELDPNSSSYINVTLGDTHYSVVGGDAGLFFLLSLLLWFGYAVVLPGRTGWTVGKAAMGIRLVRDDGRSRAGIGRSLARELLRAVDAFPYLIPYLTGFVLAKATARNKRVGDMVAGTLVVRKAALAPAGAPGEGIEPVGLVAAPVRPAPPGTPTPAAPGPATEQPANWYPDPRGEHRLRYWDGSTWTDHTAD